jgi:nucleotide-binding universal stress UspA family protein
VREGVADFVNKSKADLVVMGTRNLGAVKKFFLGSFSSYLLSHIHLDVLLVHNPLEAQPSSVEHEHETIN